MKRKWYVLWRDHKPIALYRLTKRELIALREMNPDVSFRLPKR